MKTTPLPVTAEWLERYRLKAMRYLPPSLLGSQQRRRRGQSLEFHDYAPYQAGDDFRHIDWVASGRRGGGLGALERLVVRHFVAEDRLQLVISIDTRESMRGPEAMPKLQVALWIAQAVASIALGDGNRVVLHNLFAPQTAPVAIGGSKTHSKSILARTLQHFAASPLTEGNNLAGLERYLPPTAVWLVLSDFYFEPELGAPFARRLNAAMEGYRTGILVDLDSWPAERALVENREVMVLGPGISKPEHERRYRLHAENLRLVESRIAAHKAEFRNSINLADESWSRWSWPAATSVEAGDFFRKTFADDAAIGALFSRRF